LKGNKKRAADYEQQNRRAAETILREPERYGGPESLVARWALAVMKRAYQEQAEPFAERPLPFRHELREQIAICSPRGHRRGNHAVPSLASNQIER
jgi:hypothetical protein